MGFKYLICLDFEATCWQDGRNKYNSEIIGKYKVLFSAIFHTELNFASLTSLTRNRSYLAEYWNRSNWRYLPLLCQTNSMPQIESILYQFDWNKTKFDQHQTAVFSCVRKFHCLVAKICEIKKVCVIRHLQAFVPLTGPTPRFAHGQAMIWSFFFVKNVNEME